MRFLSAAPRRLARSRSHRSSHSPPPCLLARPCPDPTGAALTQQIRSQAGPDLDWTTHPDPPTSCPSRRPTSDHCCSASSPGPRPAAAAATYLLWPINRHLSSVVEIAGIPAASVRRRRSRDSEPGNRGRECFRVNGPGARGNDNLTGALRDRRPAALRETRSFGRPQNA